MYNIRYFTIEDIQDNSGDSNLFIPAGTQVTPMEFDSDLVLCEVIIDGKTLWVDIQEHNLIALGG